MNDYDRYQKKIGEVSVWCLAIVTVFGIIGLGVWQLSQLAAVLVGLVGILAMITVCSIGLWYGILSVRAAAAMRIAANPNGRHIPWWVGEVLMLLLVAFFAGLLFLAKHR